jgi:Uncharacterised nucleotidyltransferase
MDTSRSQLRQTLIEMLALHKRTPIAANAPVTMSDWSGILCMARQHRLRPLLYWQLSNCPPSAPLPKPVEDELAADFRLHTLRSLELRAAIIRIQRCLRERGIEAAFLKGAFLAFQVYPHPALRPLRDLDVLVPRERSLAAFDALMNAGFARYDVRSGDPAAATLYCKHLPPLISQSGSVLVELHTRLFETHADCGSAPGELADDPHVWDRRIYSEEGQERVAYLSPADQLLHVMVHAIVDHHLDNGPLTLADIAYLVRQTQIDWPSFWKNAATGGWLKVCWLLLHAVDRLYVPLAFPRPEFADLPRPSEHLIDAVGTLMLDDRGRRLDLGLGAEMQQAGPLAARARVLLGRLFPSRGRLAAYEATSQRHLPVARAYLAHWWRLASVRLPEYLAHRRAAGFSEEAGALARLQSWMETRQSDS